MTTTVTIHPSLSALERAVRGRMDRSAQPGLHDRLDWFRLLLRYCPPAGRPAFVHAECERGGLALPLAVRGWKGRALGNWYTLRWAPVTWGDPSALLGAVAAALRRLGAIDLEPLDPDQAAEIAAEFRAAGWCVGDRPAKANWVAHVAGVPWARYWAARPSRVRNTVARKAKKAGLETTVHTSFDASAWADYERIYAESWKPDEGAPAFLRALAEAEGVAGTLRLGIARRGDLPVAAQLWLVEGRVATIHKLAYLQLERAHSPGSILSAAMFEYVLTHDAPDLISYGLGDEPYKADWMDERRVMRALELRNPRHPLGLALLAKARLRRLVKRGSAD